tara:strand:- start:91 stop:369 length:279 start_codon:yes stop_codon:yes gene_type:complete
MDVTANGGISVSGVYVRISDISGFKNKDDGLYYMTYGCQVYVSEAEANNGADQIPVRDIDRFKCEYDLASADNALMQAYDNLKSRYPDAVDA